MRRIHCRLSTINYPQLIAFLLLLGSCEPHMGDKFDGKWQLKEVTGKDGITQPVDTVWYNFQNSLFMYQLYDDSTGEGTYMHCYGYKEWDGGDTMTLELNDYTQESGSIDDFLRYTDWENSLRRFTIEKSSGKELIMSSGEYTYLFRKF